ncbi:hypothetical protein Plhal304r1_c003g0010791 [Plasmopara halstedii]
MHQTASNRSINQIHLIWSKTAFLRLPRLYAHGQTQLADLYLTHFYWIEARKLFGVLESERGVHNTHINETERKYRLNLVENSMDG